MASWNATTTSVSAINSACANGASYTGTVFGPGGYFEARGMAPTLQNYGTAAFIFGFPIEWLVGSQDHMVELDIQEFDNSVALVLENLIKDI